MARAKSKKLSDPADLTSALVDGAAKHFAKADGITIQAADDFLQDEFVGIGLERNLALEYIIGKRGLPMNVFSTIVGEYSATKSSYGWWLGSQVMRQGGIMCFIEVEDKTQKAQVRGILRRAPNKNLITARVETLEDLFNVIKSICRDFSRMSDGTTPMFMLVDSLNTALSKKVGALFTKNGEDKELPGYSGAHDANSIKEQIRGINKTLLYKSGIHVCLINHQTTKIEESAAAIFANKGGPSQQDPGGRFKNYQYCLAFQLKKGRIKHELGSGYKHFIRMSCGKTSLGPPRPGDVVVPYVVRYYEIDGQLGYAIEYDWDWALAALLTDERHVLKTMATKVLGGALTRNSELSYTCKVLGVEAGHPSEIGKRIRANPELCDKIRLQLLRIGDIKLLCPEVEIEEQETTLLDGAAIGKSGVQASVAGKEITDPAVLKEIEKQGIGLEDLPPPPPLPDPPTVPGGAS